ncbi:MAG: 50S ribosomal protein L35 [Candidatus Terrybacteria bacterium RIFCSPHIGHO2_01_FULL_48_17]|uniref:Large ribosomal subunit protein bL35 n=1 Tax=Candidatus Terrybacteria bacterium RIFCSPHIGHO2_01_FULL_48_17 TaxID=1802362 RepID=A0A1G2PMN2_9BACT|nr:MAG: 50S ribosomal protein L35 [Candidatus Terrybacteria bacterium RIFCSPHIGHO2_01_FULL_48_17]
MPKRKTNKSVKARFKITKRGIILRKRAGQDHFRAKKSGGKRRQLRQTIKLSKADKKAIIRYLYR